MRTFTFYKSKETISRTYGGVNYTLQVYELIDNKPVHITEVKACTRGHRGEIHEVNYKLKQLGLINPESDYYSHDQSKRDFEIIEL
jgi:predicted transcriptional regulator of viral defense system